MSLVGAHVSASGGLYRVFERADELNCSALQLFTKSQLRWSSKPLTEEEIVSWNTAAAQSKVKQVVAHASYLINLAGEPELCEKSKTSLIEEIERCKLLGIDRVVLHPGSCGQNDLTAALKLLASSLLEVLDRTADCCVKILLETMAGQGTSIGRKLEEFARVLEYVKYSPRIAFCADTCHVFAAGYDISTDEGFEDFAVEFDRNAGLDRLLCWHLNDSKKPCGSRVDRHEHIGKGEIGLVPFKKIVTDNRFKNVPSLLETPKDGPGDKINLAILNSFL